MFHTLTQTNVITHNKLIMIIITISNPSINKIQLELLHYSKAKEHLFLKHIILSLT